MLRLMELAQALVRQQRDPVAFLEEQQERPHRLWWLAWLWRAGTACVVLAVLGFAARSSGHPWGKMVLYAFLLPAIMQALCGLVIMMIGQPQFWLLYAWSPPVLILALAWGLMPLSSIWLLIGWRTGFPFLISTLVSDACTMWVYKRVEEMQHDRQRMRTGGPVAELPALALWQRVRWMRLGTSLGLALAGWLFLRDGVFALASVFGGLHLHVALLAWTCKSPLVQFDRQRGRWRATYAGHSTLFVPLTLMRPILALSDSDRGAALLALMQASCLEPIVRREVREMSVGQAHHLILHLSLQEGGAAAIRYLEPVLPRPLQPAAVCYAALASEAAKPLDLQHWVTTLAKPFPGTDDMTGPEAGMIQMLYNIREALMAFAYDQILDTAVNDLQQSIQILYGLQPLQTQTITWLKTLPMAWPVALLFHLELHRKRLCDA